MNDTLPMLNTNTTTDQVLVELAGLHAYIKYEKGDKLNTSSGTKFEVYDTHYEHPTGLDAMTVQNLNTGEYIIVYQGTQVHAKYGIADLGTNMQLLAEQTPQQLEAANQYYLDMQQELVNSGNQIAYLAGNSLGGALANSVAVRHSDVKSVTLNPALLPSGLISSEADYSNITNYISEYDVLNIGIRSGQLAGRVPGNQYDIYNGVPAFGAIGPNHTGYHRRRGEKSIVLRDWQGRRAGPRENLSGCP
ncbi:Uncharacterised protein family (UPF0227) [Evansella caseinilytica]|uniref:Uncharacterized protein family (UPF0227) n=1 Tax=Evansella caseinilytica TaxID=1503961 RepID=A0A1H3I2G1_9BACI|nr:YqiA/YcfP family alpha/beta fold hydrolase [Evansella caseinilytica]SDY21615.1 Uncharacterised protein family (UPF0227) [Evansella caseinilytica]